LSTGELSLIDAGHGVNVRMWFVEADQPCLLEELSRNLPLLVLHLHRAGVRVNMSQYPSRNAGLFAERLRLLEDLARVGELSLLKMQNCCPAQRLCLLFSAFRIHERELVKALGLIPLSLQAAGHGQVRIEIGGHGRVEFSGEGQKDAGEPRAKLQKSVGLVGGDAILDSPIAC